MDRRNQGIILTATQEKITSSDGSLMSGACQSSSFASATGAGSFAAAAAAANLVLNCVDASGPSDGLVGVMPNFNDTHATGGMPHKDTAAMSLVSNYPWLFKETDAVQNQSQGVTGLYRGTGNSTYEVVDNYVAIGTQQDPADTFPVTHNNDAFTNYSNNGGKANECQIATNSCKADSSNSTDTSEFWTRLALDSCTNQYILPLGLNPTVVLNEGFRSDFYPWNENYCQGLFLTPVPCKPDLVKDHTGKTCLKDTGEKDGNMYDYRAWGYLERAWVDVLYTKDSSGNPKPYSPASSNPNTLLIGNNKGQISLPTAIDGYNKYGSLSGSTSDKGNIGFNYSQPGTSLYSGGNQYDYTKQFTGNLTAINELTQRPYERIWDSTHPFTPRWDVATNSDGSTKNDQAYYSPKTIISIPLAAQKSGSSNPVSTNNTNCQNTTLQADEQALQTAQAKLTSDTSTCSGNESNCPCTATPTKNCPTSTVCNACEAESADQTAVTNAQNTLNNDGSNTNNQNCINTATNSTNGSSSGSSLIGTGYINPAVMALDKVASFFTNVNQNNTVRCAVVPVDILNFRATEFDACMMSRINANSDCFWHEYLFNNLLLYCCDNNGDKYPDPLTALLAVSLGDSWNDCNNLPNAIDGIGCQNYWSSNEISDFLDPDQRCKTNLVNNTVPAFNPSGKSGQWPPCSTMYDYPFDNVPALCKDAITKANDYADNQGYGSAPDYGDSFSDGSSYGGPTSTKKKRLSSVTKCCNDLAQPVAPINTLKIRNLQDDPTLADQNGNVAEGYKFSDYFTGSDGKVHMPYMRWWDTGTAAGGAAQVNPGQATGFGLSSIPGLSGLSSIPLLSGFTTINYNDPLLGTNYDPNSTQGQDDVIVGIGIESTKKDSDGTTYAPAGLCRYGGSAGKGYGGDSCIKGPPKVNTCTNCWKPSSGTPATRYADRLTSWYELKQAQVNMLRDFGMDCLPVYEQMWKWASAEDGALIQAGRHFNSVVPEPNDPTNSTGEFKSNPWPLRWRGYLSDSQKTISGQANSSYPYRFPNFDVGPGGTGGAPPSAAVMTGLDNAQTGDIIYVYQTDDASTKGGVFPFMAVVLSAQKGSNSCQDNIIVQDMNNGKFPDACGITNQIGMGPPRTIYKEWLPPNVQDALFAGGDDAEQTDSCGDSHTVTSISLNAPKKTAAGNCMDPKYAACTFNNTTTNTNYWDQIHVYRPSLDERGDTTTNGSR